MIIRIDANRIHDWNSFHDVFAQAFGFPDYYGRNMDAWIDCMTGLDDPPESAQTSVHVAPGDIVTLVVDNAGSFKQRCPDLYEALVECTAFVNWRRVERGDDAILALALHA